VTTTTSDPTRIVPPGWSHDPTIAVPWCEAVGLDPTRYFADGAEIVHEGWTHVAVLTEAPRTCHPAVSPPPRVSRRIVVDVLPEPCPLHPDVPVVPAR
jgi:hypothetical protein